MTKETKQIEATTLADFCKLSQDLILDGWKFDLESNAGYPTAFGTFFSATLHKQAEVLKAVVDQVQKTTAVVSEAVTEAISEVVEQVTAASSTEVDTDVATKGSKRKASV